MNREGKSRRNFFIAGFLITLVVLFAWQRAFGEVVTFATGIYFIFFGCLSFIVVAAFYLRLYVIEEQVYSSLMSVALGAVIACTSEQALLFLPERMLSVMSVVMMFAGIALFLLYLLFLRMKGRAPAQIEWMNIAAALVLLLLAAACLIANEVSGRTNAPIRVLVAAGSSFYMITQMFNYFIFATESYETHSENVALARIAYEDVLTKLYNRASWDEKMRLLDQGESDYCIISLDMDGLKAVNDAKGHTAGDRLIANFATELAMSFREPCFAARIGGDEFCVIIENETEDEVKERLADLEERLAELDRVERGISHKCSYGYALSEGVVGAKSHDIYLDADARMYRMKAEHKRETQIVNEVMETSNESRVAQFVQEALGLFSISKWGKKETEEEVAAAVKERVSVENARDERIRRERELSNRARKEREQERQARKTKAQATEDALSSIRRAQQEQESKEQSIARALDMLKEFEKKE